MKVVRWWMKGFCQGILCAELLCSAVESRVARGHPKINWSAVLSLCS